MEHELNPFLPDDVTPKTMSSRYYYLVRHCFRIGWELVKKPKPCYVGDKVHLNTREGVYTVVDVKMKHFITSTKKDERIKHEWIEYKCHAGGGKNL